MRTIRTRRLAAAVAVPLLLLGVAACSDDEPTDAASETPTETQSPTETPTETETPTDEETDSPGGQVVADPTELFDAMQAAMKEAGTAQVAMDVGMGTANGAMDYSSDEPSMTMMTDLGGVKIEMRFVDGELYVSMPPAPQGKFYKLGASDRLGLGDTLKGSSPSDSAAEIAQALEKLVEVGDEDIAGEATTHYVATIDTAKASLLSGGGPDLGGGSIDLPEALDVDLWVTEDDLIRRIVMELGAVSMQLDYTAWGEPVDISAPAASDILETPKGLGL